MLPQCTMNAKSVLKSQIIFWNMSYQGQTGKKIQHYIFNYSDFIGNGNFSKCYRATNTITQEQVAIKIVELNSLKSKKLEELLYSEIGVLKQLSHPNVLRCLQVFTSNRNCYIVTELCNEGDLESKFKQKRHFQQKQIRNIIADVYSGLLYLGSKGIVHRDLKIANIFVHNGVSKIADFGFAVHHSGIFKDLNIGSPLYMSPEGIHSNLYGAKTDIWAFGIMIYELYHGKTPFSHCASEESLKSNVIRPLQWSQINPSIPNDAKELILACMTVQEDKRPHIQDLNNLTYIQQALRNRDNPGYIELNFQSPLKQHLTFPNFEGESVKRTRNIQRTRTAYQSVERYRGFDRATTPQKIAYNPQLVNASLTLKPSMDQNEYNPPFNNTYSHSFQSPQPRKMEPSPFKIQPNNTQTIVTPLKINQEYLNKTGEEFQKIQKNVLSLERTHNLISCQINFKQSVNILHYCRLIFKYLNIYKEIDQLREPYQKKHYAILGHYLLTILEEVHDQVLKKRIRYEGENPELREKKLREVTDEYLRKYGKELDKNTIESYLSEQEKGEINLNKIKETAWAHISNYSLSESCSGIQAIASQLLLTIYSSTILIETCFMKKSYASFQKSKEIEEMLNRNKDSFSYSSYMKHKNKKVHLLTNSA